MAVEKVKRVKKVERVERVEKGRESQEGEDGGEGGEGENNHSGHRSHSGHRQYRNRKMGREWDDGSQTRLRREQMKLSAVVGGGPHGFSAKPFSATKWPFSLCKMWHITDMRCEGMDTDGDACIHRCIQHFAALGVAPHLAKLFFSFPQGGGRPSEMAVERRPSKMAVEKVERGEER